MASIKAENVCVEFPIIGADRSFRKEVLGGQVGGLFGKKGNSNKISTVKAITNLTLECCNKS